VPEIPLFLRLKTKNAREIMELLDKVAEGKVLFPDGKPVETVAIDSWSIVWSVAQEVAAVNAEQRAARNKRDVETATMTQLDWVIAKRLPKRILNRLNGTPVKYFILIAREKDQYVEKANGDLVKEGVTADVVKGTEYEMNLALHFGFEVDKWYYETTKVQGALSNIFPLHKKGYDFPIKDVIVYAAAYEPDDEKPKDDEEIAREIVDIESCTKSYSGLLEFAAGYGLDKDTLSIMLRAAGFKSFKIENWEAMIAIIKSYFDI